ncbi:MAG TPA: OmpA family protein [Acetobacteraceae bacterium]
MYATRYRQAWEAPFVTRKSLIAAASLLCAGSAAFAPGSFAQGSPSADQIINSLKPTGALGCGTRGIRPVAPGTPAPAAAPTMPKAMHMAPAAPTRMASPAAAAKPASVDLSVQFQTASAELAPAAMHTLDQLGQALTSSALSSYRFRIAGHTDTVGSPEPNKALSDQRAAAVAAYLESKFNVTPNRLETVGMGESDLLVATPPQTPEPRNRRVQVINLGA